MDTLGQQAELSQHTSGAVLPSASSPSGRGRWSGKLHSLQQEHPGNVTDTSGHLTPTSSAFGTPSTTCRRPASEQPGQDLLQGSFHAGLVIILEFVLIADQCKGVRDSKLGRRGEGKAH